MSVTVTFWGTRGTIPTPGPGTARFGGNTACVSVQDQDGHRVVFDAGTGIRALGHALGDTPAAQLDLCLSHVHWDHIQGLPFFRPLFVAGQAIRIRGPAPEGISLAAVLARQMDPAVYPVPCAARAGELEVEEIAAGSTHDAPGFAIETMALSHPGGALGYRITHGASGHSVAYITDNELGAGGASRVTSGWRDRLVRFVSGASLLVHDGMYSASLGRSRTGWGHSTAGEAVALAGDAGVRRLALFHHDPDHDDAQVAALLAEVAGRAPTGLAVSAAAEGFTVEL